jgi:hypothetical protein
VAGRDRSGTVAFFSTLATGWQQSATSTSPDTHNHRQLTHNGGKSVSFERNGGSEVSRGHTATHTISTAQASAAAAAQERSPHHEEERKNESEAKAVIGRARRGDGEENESEGDEVAKHSDHSGGKGLSSPEREAMLRQLRTLEREREAMAETKAKHVRLRSSASAVDGASHKELKKEKQKRKKEKKGSARAEREPHEDPGSDADSSGETAKEKKRTFKSLVNTPPSMFVVCRVCRVVYGVCV